LSQANLWLDGRSYDDLIAEARRRVALACPELGVNGGPDPGLTLIELFAWMFGLAIERLGRVPDKLHLALLDMLGIQLHGPAAARTPVRMRLSAPAQQPLQIRSGTEIGTLRTATEESVVFQVQDDFTIEPLRPAAYVIERAGAAKEIGVADGVAYPHGPDQLPFAQPPVVGDALYLGFESTIGRLLMQVTIEASMARGAGVNPEDPPLRWEVSQGEGAWAEVDVLEDVTGGFNYGSGNVEVQCPPRSGVEPLAGRRLHWLRCRISETTRSGGQTAVYQHAPEIYQITAAPIGALLPAENSTAELAEQLGISDGLPGQALSVRFAPVLGLAGGETIEVQSPAGDWDPWDEVDSFAASNPDDRHFALDPVHGRIRFGPELRDPNGRAAQRGAIPPKGAAVRMSHYRHGGGHGGNVPAGTLTSLRSALPGVASVTNPAPALGGVNSQDVDSVRSQAALEIRTRYRAVTAEDYEFLATEASPRVARALRVQSDEPGVTLRILPRVDPANRRLTIDELTPDVALLEDVERYLDSRKLVGCPVRLLPVRFRGVSVVVNLQAGPRADTQRIEREVRDSLYNYLNPVIGGTAGTPGQGWPFGRSLNQGELYAIVHAFGNVEFVTVLRLYEVNLLTGERATQAAGRQILLEPDELIASGEHIVRVVRRDA
jgi:predicted phage baseplate assembly protein